MIYSTFLHLTQLSEVSKSIRLPVSPCISNKNVLLTPDDRGSATYNILYHYFQILLLPFCLLVHAPFRYSLFTFYYIFSPSHSVFDFFFPETCALFPSSTPVLVSLFPSRAEQSRQSSDLNRAKVVQMGFR